MLLTDEELIALHGLDICEGLEVARAIAKAQHEKDMQEFVKWGKEKCPDGWHNHPCGPVLKCHECPHCWQSLKAELEGTDATD